MVRVGVKLMLSRLNPQVNIIEAQDYPEAAEKCESNPDIELILLDRMMPGMDGLTGLIALRRLMPDIPIVVMSASEDHAHIKESLDNGAQGYIPKSCGEEIMESALKLVLSGGTYIPPTLLQKDGVVASGTREAASGLEENNRDQLISALTQRQLEVLTLVTRGMSDKQIASKLSISAATVRSHLNVIFKVLKVNNRTEAVHVASRIEFPQDS